MLHDCVCNFVGVEMVPSSAAPALRIKCHDNLPPLPLKETIITLYIRST